jgi:hypothetical protein
VKITKVHPKKGGWVPDLGAPKSGLALQNGDTQPLYVIFWGDDFYGVLDVILCVHFCCFTDFNSLLLPILTACMAGHSHINICSNNNNKEDTVLVRWAMGLAWLPSWQWDHI